MESLQHVMEIANRVKGTANKVEINQQQCNRLAMVFDGVGKSLKLLITADKDYGQQSAEIEALDALLHVFESGELLVLEYAGPNWFRNLVTSQDNKEAFKEIYDDLQDILNFMSRIRFDDMYYISDDAAQGRDEMLKSLSDDAAQDRDEMLNKLDNMKAQQSIMFGTSTADFERSSEQHIQSYSLEIAFRKLKPRWYTPESYRMVPLDMLYLTQSRICIEDLAEASAVAEERKKTRAFAKVRKRCLLLLKSGYRCCTRKQEKGDDVRVDASTTIVTTPLTIDDVVEDVIVDASTTRVTTPLAIDDVADDLRVERRLISLDELFGRGTYSEVRVAERVDASTTRVTTPLAIDDLRVEPCTIKLGEVLGKGASSEVRVAEWVDCEFAVKILRASDVRALRNEVRIHMELRHPHIVQLVGFSADKDKCMILMERMDGDLGSHIASKMKGKFREPPFSLHEAIDLMIQIALGMQFLHFKGVVHGDLKTENVLLMRKGDRVHLKITDFGVSKEKLGKALEGVYEHRIFSGKVGSGFYRAPEILKATLEGTSETEPKYSGKADVYSFAMTASEILTGLVPFENKSSTTRESIVDGDRPELPLPSNSTLKELNELIERCWHDDQDVRPSFEEICKNLKRLKLFRREHSQSSLEDVAIAIVNCVAMH